ncbi:MAG: 2-amino-4-hydroxy-6-hydroxymethyldihydropteridine diphosphokinase [Firmicutes bacterium]|nr:2-amino-4-hydroxy-6-hydroxymethyldihydropteridine diphosphokinase [Bacillota bacterium]
MQKIIVKNLKVMANHGVLESEKISLQPFIISATVTLNEIAKNDNLVNTINYVEVCDNIIEIATQNRYNLIETLSDEIAKNILYSFNLAKSVSVEVQKPNAPIKHNLDFVATTSERTWHIAYLGLGSNLGDRKFIIEHAIEHLNCYIGICVEKTSTIIKSEPYGKTDQPAFLNAVIKIKTFFTPYELLAICKDEEVKLGRQKREKWAERELDIDILIYDDLHIITDTLTLPHPDMLNRDFVLNPLKEIEPNLFTKGKILS